MHDTTRRRSIAPSRRDRSPDLQHPVRLGLYSLPVLLVVWVVVANASREDAVSVQAPLPVISSGPVFYIPEQVDVPDVEGTMKESAVAILRSLGLESTVNECYSHVAEGTVLNQLPLGGSSVAEGGFIRLRVAKPYPRATGT